MILGPDAKPVSSGERIRPQASEHAFEAAKRGGYKGWFYFPSLEPSAQLPRDTRERTAEKINWLYNNVGAVQAVIDGLALDEVDTGIWPRAASQSPDFNRALTEAFDNLGKDPRVFHSGGRENVYSAQYLIRRSIRLHGELFGQLLMPESGSGAPMMHFINPWQCRNASTSQDQSLWTEGQMLNRLGRTMQYRFVTNREGTSWTDQSADDVLHFHDQFWNSQTRGISGLAPVARKLFSIDDIERAETSGTLLRTRVAYAIEKKEGTGDAGPSLMPGATETETMTNSKGEEFQIQKVLARDGSEVDVADLPAGFSMKLVESTRATMGGELINHLLKDVAYCTKYPPDYVFNLAQVTNGTLVRMLQKRVQRVKNTVRQFQLAPQFLSRWYTFFAWQLIKSGFFARQGIEVPVDWWRHRVIYPADDTVDVGREGRLYDDRLATGKMSPVDYHGIQGRDDDEVEDEIIQAAKRRYEKLLQVGVDKDKAWGVTFGTLFGGGASAGKVETAETQRRGEGKGEEVDEDDDEEKEKGGEDEDE